MDALQVQVPCPNNPEQNPTQDAITSNPPGEVEMGGTLSPQPPKPTAQNPTPTEAEDAVLVHVQEAQLPAPAVKSPQLGFLDFLTSPIVEIVVGEGEHETVLKAHQALLIQSPFLSERVQKLETSGPRRILLPADNVEALTCFLQFQYTRDYTVPGSKAAAAPESGSDESGKQLLHHARVYTLAEKLGLPELKSLAHKKIHMVGGTPAGELVYARYVYTHTPAEDTVIRRPIAAYWASHSHKLRHGIEEEFKKLCIEVPEFTFDMLTIVLDRKEKSRDAEVDSTPRGSARKRLRSEK